MKKLTLLLVMSLLISGAFSQRGGTAPLAKGEKQINFGLGLNNHGMPVYGSFDIALHKDVTLTPEIHLLLPSPWHDRFGAGILVKADYHWNYLIGIPKNWDFYAGARVGVSFSGKVWPNLGIEVGGRWYWNDKWGLNVELAAGTGITATFGLSCKL